LAIASNADAPTRAMAKLGRIDPEQANTRITAT
jgi:hypothetical protein